MRRTRSINSSPERSAWATVDVLVQVISASLVPSKVDSARVNAALEAARPALLMLISGRHLKAAPVVLVAAETICEFYCRYDDAAVGGEENLNPIPGLTAAETFTIHLPASGPLVDTIAGLIATNEHLTIAPPPTEVKTANAAVAAPLDLASLREML